jgi:hypothetical protein
MIELPSGKSPATQQGPRELVIFSKPKCGKTSALAELKDNLIIAMDPRGADYIDAMKIDVYKEAEKQGIEPWLVLGQIITALKTANKKYDFISLDTITELEDIVVPYAGVLYKETPMGKNWGKEKGEDDVRKLPNGSGYTYTRMAFSKIKAAFLPYCNHLILVGHLKEKSLEKNGKEFTASELDLSGKNKAITAAEADAIGYMYRDGNTNVLSFATNDTVLCGARPKHLTNKEITISKLNEDGTFETYWEAVFPELNKTSK